MSRTLAGGIPRPLASLRNRRIWAQARGAWRGLRKGFREAGRPDFRVASLEPDGPSRGRVLISFKVAGFFDEEPLRSHTQYWESVAMARIWAELGFQVDLVDNDNPHFVPTRGYDFLVATRISLESIARQLNPECVKILHIDTGHWLFSNTASHQRTLDLQRRRGVTLTRILQIDRNHAIEVADLATMLGNARMAETFAYAGKPIHLIPISSPHPFDWPAGKDFEACRTRFVWFGGRGAVHKGLDLVLDAFAGLPEFHLTVVGPIREPDFEAAYRKELYQTPNIKSVGWVYLDGPEFPAIARESLALVFPSCSESQSGSAVACLHAGLIPVVTEEVGMDVDPAYGILLPSACVEEIRSAVRKLASRSPAELEAMARKAHEFARANHTRGRFQHEYRRVVSEVIGTSRGLPVSSFPG